jgi:hypothetical protein
LTTHNQKRTMKVKKTMLLAALLALKLTVTTHAQPAWPPVQPYRNFLTWVEEREAEWEAYQATLPEENRSPNSPADFVTPLLGEGWREVWAASELEDPNFEMINIYLQQSFPTLPEHVTFVRLITFATNSAAFRRAWLDAVAEKEQFDQNDISLVTALAVHSPAIEARIGELAALLPSGNIRGQDYYQFRNINVLRRPAVRQWETTMRVSEWIDLATQPAHVSPAIFAAGRDRIMLRLAQMLVEKRRSEGLSTEGEEFEAAFAPLSAALRAPKFGGLRDAVRAAGLPLNIPEESDWSAQEAVAADVKAAAERGGMFMTSWGAEYPYEQGLGSVMFVLGEEAYEQWRQALLADD